MFDCIARAMSWIYSENDNDGSGVHGYVGKVNPLYGFREKIKYSFFGMGSSLQIGREVYTFWQLDKAVVIPKGTDFDNMSKSRVKEVEEWMNHYPRKIYEYRSSEELYLKELKLLE